MKSCPTLTVRPITQKIDYTVANSASSSSLILAASFSLSSSFSRTASVSLARTYVGVICGL